LKRAPPVLRGRDARSESGGRPSPRPACRAGNGTRTRDPNLGKVVLYQLSYSRVGPDPVASNVDPNGRYAKCGRTDRRPVASSGGGGEGNRTPDLLNAIQALSQLSYAPSAERRQLFRQETRSVVRGRDDVKKFRAGAIRLGRYFAALSNPIGARAIQDIGPPANLLGLAAPMRNGDANASLTINHFTRSTSRARQ
jgi:hypothetical protein